MDGPKPCGHMNTIACSRTSSGLPKTTWTHENSRLVLDIKWPKPCGHRNDQPLLIHQHGHMNALACFRSGGPKPYGPMNALACSRTSSSPKVYGLKSPISKQYMAFILYICPACEFEKFTTLVCHFFLFLHHTSPLVKI